MTGEQIAAEIERLARWPTTGEPEDYITTLDLTRYVRAHLPAILRHLRAASPEAVERAAVALYESMRTPYELEWAAEGKWLQENYRRIARATLRAAVSS
jgi:plasmid stabilization system protein ParE